MSDYHSKAYRTSKIDKEEYDKNWDRIFGKKDFGKKDFGKKEDDIKEDDLKFKSSVNK